LIAAHSENLYAKKLLERRQQGASWMNSGITNRVEITNENVRDSDPRGPMATESEALAGAGELVGVSRDV
jgi:hypothetical protein